MEAAKKYLNHVKDDIQVREVNLTTQQITAIKQLQKIFGQNFENTVLLLVNHGLQEIEDSYINSRIRNSTIKN